MSRITDEKTKSLKEKTENILIYLAVILAIFVVFQLSYNCGLEKFANRESDIPIGQEYRVKDIIPESNATYLIRYYENDNNMTEKTLVSSSYINITFIKSNSTNMMTLKKFEKGVQYWNIYTK